MRAALDRVLGVDRLHLRVGIVGFEFIKQEANTQQQLPGAIERDDGVLKVRRARVVGDGGDLAQLRPHAGRERRARSRSRGCDRTAASGTARCSAAAAVFGHRGRCSLGGHDRHDRQDRGKRHLSCGSTSESVWACQVCRTLYRSDEARRAQRAPAWGPLVACPAALAHTPPARTCRAREAREPGKNRSFDIACRAECRHRAADPSSHTHLDTAGLRGTSAAERLDVFGVTDPHRLVAAPRTGHVTRGKGFGTYNARARPKFSPAVAPDR